ncbi:extracellular solute-binding protein [Beggiatoa leptomitoformis]|uniref:ABC transporter substrate-binding protein n=1 Tax=Beggiatoa leptomitoformis TaxID=288004 RepID=A0A2N9YF93_9GAMM|nr:extracellular solute-binding protein [Beggiatoa leptomitoformis]ALG68525.1 ABC transporter substrate-binding protein [Beggiatoa leptomitoformis]AUI69133.1 ABC transporter substrate-binding protein [Beggiatoa leptomitoformis]
MRAFFLFTLLLVSNAPTFATEQNNGNVTVGHGMSMYGDLKYPPNFKHFEYANPDAPKGGTVRLADIGTYDSFNPFIIKGIPPAGIGGLFETLTVNSDDEAFSVYGLIAETIEVPEDRTWVAYQLRSIARFHDGTPITPEDVIFSFEILKEKGNPFYRSYYENVTKVEKVDEHKVKFTFINGTNKELPLIMGQLPILSKAYWSTREFDKTTLEAPLGSGAYKIDTFEAGRFVVYKRVPDYWGANLPVNLGQENFDTIRYDYYRDSTVALQAFKAGEYDFRSESTAKDWATAYDFPAVKTGLVIKEEITHEIPTGMQAFFFNTRRPLFADPKVREAIGYLFDFEWSNKNLFYNAYTRTDSFFSNSELAAHNLPSAEEQAILEPFKNKIPEHIFTTAYQPPSSDGSGNIRDNIRKALGLLTDAGWEFKQNRLVNKTTGKPFDFEILLDSPAFERISLPFAKNLERVGIKATIRTVDSSQYKNRLDDFDFDMIVAVVGQSLSPGNEQRDYWGSNKADIKGTRNYAGIKDPVIDALIEQVIAAPDRASLIAHTRALDRVLLSGYYVIPHWHIRTFRVAYWNKFMHPNIAPKYGLGFNTWWIDKEKAQQLDAKRGK